MFVKRRMTMRDKTFPFQGHLMHYSVVGTGDPVILVHGGMHADPWGGFQDILGRHYRAYIPHLPGFGASDAVSGRTHSIPLFAEALSSFMEQRGLEHAPVIGFSLGAATALCAFAQYGYSGTLILAGTPVGVTEKKLKYAQMIPLWLRRFLGSTEWGRKKILLPVMRELVGHLDRKNDIVMQKDLATTDVRSLVDLDMTRDIEQVLPSYIAALKGKAVFLYGSEDRIGRKARLHGHQVIMIPGASHNIFSSEPDKTLQVIRELLREHRS